MFFLMSGDFKVCYCCQFDKIKLFDSCIKNTTSAYGRYNLFNDHLKYHFDILRAAFRHDGLSGENVSIW